MRKSGMNSVSMENLNKRAISKLAACIDTTRNLQNNYYVELKTLLTQRMKTSASKQETAALLEIFKIGPKVTGGKVIFFEVAELPKYLSRRKNAS